DRRRPPGGLAALLGADARRRGSGWVHVGRRDPEHHRDAGPNLADHAAQELRGIRAILQGEVAARLVRERERLSSRAANAPRRLQVEQPRQRRRRDGGAREKTATGNLHTTFLYRYDRSPDLGAKTGLLRLDTGQE